MIFSFKFTNMGLAVIITIFGFMLERRVVYNNWINIKLAFGSIFLFLILLFSPIYDVFNEILLILKILINLNLMAKQHIIKL